MSTKAPIIIYWIHSFLILFFSSKPTEDRALFLLSQQQVEWIPKSWLLFDSVGKWIDCKMWKRYWNGLQSWNYILNKLKLRKTYSMCSVFPSKWNSFTFIYSIIDCSATAAFQTDVLISWNLCSLPLIYISSSPGWQWYYLKIKSLLTKQSTGPGSNWNAVTNYVLN